MRLETFSAPAFPKSNESIGQFFSDINIDDDAGGIAVYGGCARNGLFEAVMGVERPVRDIDLVAVGDTISDERYEQLHKLLNPNDTSRITVERYPNLEALLLSLDFTINQAAVSLGSCAVLTVTDLAIAACKAKIIEPTEARIRQTLQFQAGGEAALKLFLRNRTNVPARAAYFVATLRAAGINFNFDLLDHPRPASPEEAHTFFLGLMLRKALMVDELERGPGDVTASSLLIDLYREMDMTKAAQPQTPEQVISFCEDVQRQHPHLRFYGSAVSERVQHVEPAPVAT